MPKQRYEKDEKGLYYVCVPTNEFRKDGYRKYKRLRAKTQPELDKKLQAYNDNLKVGVVSDKTTVDAWFKRWLRDYKGGVAENTRKFYENLYRTHISPVIGPAKLTDVREIDAQGLLNRMAQTHAESTVKSVRKILFSLFDTARKNKLLPFNPCADLTATGRRPQERRALTEQERRAFLKYCKTSPHGDFGAFLYFFGLRRGEALALTGADVKSDCIVINKQVTYPDNNAPVLKLTPKTDAGFREIPIPDKARKYIDFKNLPDGLLFPGDDGKPLTYSPMIDRWNALITGALGDDTDVTMHYLRHNYCTMLFEAGLDLMAVKTLAGHNDIKTTLEIYTHYTESLKKHADEKIHKIG
jgi:integrase